MLIEIIVWIVVVAIIVIILLKFINKNKSGGYTPSGKSGGIKDFINACCGHR